MPGGMAGDMGDGLVHAVHNAHGQDIVQKLGVKVLLTRGRAGDDPGRRFVKTQLDGDKTLFPAVVNEALFQAGQKVRRDVPVHQQDLFRVADGGTAGLGVLDDVQRPVQIRCLVYKDVADARAGLDAGDLRVLQAAADQTRAAAGDQQVYETDRLHQLIRALMIRILHKADQLGGQPGVLEAVVNGLNNGPVRAEGFFPAAQDHRVARFQGQHGRVRGDVRAALIDDGDHAERGRGFLDHQAVRPFDPAQHLPLGIGQRRDLAHALGHAGDALFRQREPVHHDLAVLAFSRLDVLAVRGQDGVLLRGQPPGDGLQRGVFLFRCVCQGRQGGSGFPQNGLCVFHVFFLPIKRVPADLPSRIS